VSLSIGSAYEPVDVDLWGSAFVTVPSTKSVVAKVMALEAQVGEIEARGNGDGTPDEIVGLLADIVDAKVKPKGNGRTKAADLIRRKWNADELSIDELNSFVEALTEAEGPPR
jgi:hypothetical protein